MCVSYVPSLHITGKHADLSTHTIGIHMEHACSQNSKIWVSLGDHPLQYSVAVGTQVCTSQIRVTVKEVNGRNLA